MQLPGQESWDALGDALEESGTQSLAARQDLGGEQTLWDILSAVFGCKVPGNTLVCPQQWAAVMTQFSLIKEPPHKWDPKRLWGGKGEEEQGWAGWAPSKLGTERVSQVPLMPAHLTVPCYCSAYGTNPAWGVGKCHTRRDTCRGP